MNQGLNAYDRFAAVYDRLWAGGSCARFWPVVQKVLLSRTPPGAAVLDLCCGPGRMSGKLLESGFRPTGVDGSRGMIELARKRLPDIPFYVSPCTDLRIVGEVDAALCLYDSLNHVNADELAATFKAVFDALRPGWFMFDLNTEDGYEARWQGSFNIVKDDVVAIVNSSYDAGERTGRMQLTTFQLAEGSWLRQDVAFAQRAFDLAFVRSALTEAGFTDIEEFDAKRDFGLEGEQGRSVFVCRRSL